MPQQQVSIFTDGAARGNPGEAGIGVSICNADGSVVAELSEYIGLATNNAAEYWAVIRGLEEARARGLRRIKIWADSELLIRQLQGTYKVRHPGLKPLHARVVGLLRSFEHMEMEHLPREKNRQADSLANQAIDRVIKDSAEAAAAQVAALGTGPAPKTSGAPARRRAGRRAAPRLKAGQGRGRRPARKARSRGAQAVAAKPAEPTSAAAGPAGKPAEPKPAKPAGRAAPAEPKPAEPKPAKPAGRVAPAKPAGQATGPAAKPAGPAAGQPGEPAAAATPAPRRQGKRRRWFRRRRRARGAGGQGAGGKGAAADATPGAASSAAPGTAPSHAPAAGPGSTARPRTPGAPNGGGGAR